MDRPHRANRHVPARGPRLWVTRAWHSSAAPTRSWRPRRCCCSRGASPPAGYAPSGSGPAPNARLRSRWSWPGPAPATSARARRRARRPPAPRPLLRGSASSLRSAPGITVAGLQQRAQLHGLGAGHRVPQRPDTGNRTPPRCTIAVPTSQPLGHRPSRRRRAPCLRRSTAARCAGPPSASANPVTWPTIGLLSGGPWRQGVPVTVMAGLPSLLERGGLVLAQAHRAVAQAAAHRPRWSSPCPAPPGARGRRHPGCRRGGRGSAAPRRSARVSSAATAGPASLSDAVPQPNL